MELFVMIGLIVGVLLTNAGLIFPLLVFSSTRHFYGNERIKYAIVFFVSLLTLLGIIIVASIKISLWYLLLVASPVVSFYAYFLFSEILDYISECYYSWNEKRSEKGMSN